jgi:O-antigen biosynthesis alpha-1,3-mannosyltransferase
MIVAIDPVAIGQPSGNSVYTTELIGALLRQAPDLSVLLGSRMHRKRELTRRFGQFPNFSCDAGFLNAQTFGKIFGRGVEELLEARNRRRLLEMCRRSDLLHLTNPLSHVAGLGNYVVTLHDLIPLRREPWASPTSQAFYRQRIESVLRESRRIFVMSDYVKSECVRNFPYTASRIAVTPPAAGPAFAPQPVDPAVLRRICPDLRGMPFFLYVGEFQPRKNVVGVCEAFARLPAATRKGTRLLLAGSWRKRREYRAEIFGARERLGLGDRLSILRRASRADLVALYSAAACFVFPSFDEGFGLPALEAMSCGCPVVTSNAASLPGVVGDAGILVDPGDPDRIADAMQQVFESAERRARMRSAGLEQAKRFSWERTAALTYQGYLDAVACLPASGT